MKVSYLDSLPAGYRFTKEDHDKCWEILGWYFASYDNEMTPEQEEYTWVIHYAEGLKAKHKFWPTKESVIEEIERVKRAGYLRFDIAYTK